MSTPNEYSAISTNENTTSGSDRTSSRPPRRTLLKAAGAATLVTAAGAAVAQPAGAYLSWDCSVPPTHRADYPTVAP